MNKIKQAPRIAKILNIDGFNIFCQFTSGEMKVIDFEKLLQIWNPIPTNPTFQLLDLQIFQKVELQDGILTWPDIKIKLKDWNGIEQLYDFDLDPVVVFESGVRFKSDSLQLLAA
jgi:hypothetical protein